MTALLALYGLAALASHVAAPPDTAPTHEAAHALPPIFEEIIECESGGDPTLDNPVSSASGLYQAIDSTWDYVWRGYLGEAPPTARAKHASVEDQHRFARALYEHEGVTPWEASRACWGDGS